MIMEYRAVRKTRAQRVSVRATFVLIKIHAKHHERRMCRGDDIDDINKSSPSKGKRGWIFDENSLVNIAVAQRVGSNNFEIHSHFDNYKRLVGELSRIFIMGKIISG